MEQAVSDKLREWKLHANGQWEGTWDPSDEFVAIWTVVSLAAYEKLKAENERLLEALEQAIKALSCYQDIKVESPNSSPSEEYLAFKMANIAREALKALKGDQTKMPCLRNE